MSEVEIVQRWLGVRPYVLVELEDDGVNSEITLGGNPTKEEARILLRCVSRSVRPLKKAVNSNLSGRDVES